MCIYKGNKKKSSKVNKNESKRKKHKSKIKKNGYK